MSCYIKTNIYTKFRGKELSSHFTVDEFKCKCCGETVINKKLLDKLEKLRSYIGDIPINILDGYRCLAYNYSIGAPNLSLHTTGDAVDFVLDGNSNVIEILLKTKDFFSRIGFCQSKYDRNSFYIHVELGTQKLYWLSYYDIAQNKDVCIYFDDIEHMLAAMKKDPSIDWFGVVI